MSVDFTSRLVLPSGELAALQKLIRRIFGVLALSPGKLLKIRYHAFRKAFRGCCIGFFCWIVWRILKKKFFQDDPDFPGENLLYRFVICKLDSRSILFGFFHTVLKLWFTVFKTECKICYAKKSNLCANLLCGHCVCFDCKRYIQVCPFCKEHFRLWLPLALAILRRHRPVFYR